MYFARLSLLLLAEGCHTGEEDSGPTLRQVAGSFVATAHLIKRNMNLDGLLPTETFRCRKPGEELPKTEIRCMPVGVTAALARARGEMEEHTEHTLQRISTEEPPPHDVMEQSNQELDDAMALERKKVIQHCPPLRWRS